LIHDATYVCEVDRTVLPVQQHIEHFVLLVVWFRQAEVLAHLLFYAFVRIAPLNKDFLEALVIEQTRCQLVKHTSIVEHLTMLLLPEEAIARHHTTNICDHFRFLAKK
jgi:hypothetical protein